jgi:hypothetical protein
MLSLTASILWMRQGLQRNINRSSSTKNTTGSMESKKSNADGLSDETVQKESSKSANAAIAAQKKAQALKDAAAAAGDPDERQKLMEQAINAEIEAESYGKTAKYLRSGAFQGMAVGTGIGLAPSATLGALTGTLVGGVTSIVTGGLGAGIGAAAGAMHGPLVDVGELAGKGIRSITGDFPGWAASNEQKEALEKMIGQVNNEKMPSSSELNAMEKDVDDGELDQEWVQNIRGTMPSIPGLGSKENASKTEEQKTRNVEDQKGGTEEIKIQKPPTGANSEDDSLKRQSKRKRKPRKLQAGKSPKSTNSRITDNNKGSLSCSPTTTKRKKQPRKLEVRSP